MNNPKQQEMLSIIGKLDTRAHQQNDQYMRRLISQLRDLVNKG